MQLFLLNQSKIILLNQIILLKTVLWYELERTEFRVSKGTFSWLTEK